MDSPADPIGVAPTHGHAAVRERFERTLTRGRLASTYLFVGPAGVGKRTFAVELAAALLCGSPDHERPLKACGVCESCRLIAAGRHPDLLTVEKPAGKSSLPIELFVGRPDHRNREGLCHEIALKPYLGGRRIAIVDDADDLGVESANCLLKTLEEPPPRSVLILIGTSPSRQLPTIRSRSQVVRFGPLADAEVARVLHERGLLEEGQNAEQLAGSGAGSVTRALASADAELAAFRDTVTSVLSNARFDPIRFAASVVEQSQAAGAEPAARRERLKTILGYALEHYREQMHHAAPTGVDARLLAMLDQTINAVEAVDRNANQATLVQAWSTALANLAPGQ